MQNKVRHGIFIEDNEHKLCHWYITVDHLLQWLSSQCTLHIIYSSTCLILLVSSYYFVSHFLNFISWNVHICRINFRCYRYMHFSLPSVFSLFFFHDFSVSVLVPCFCFMVEILYLLSWCFTSINIILVWYYGCICQSALLYFAWDVNVGFNKRVLQ